jgi:alkylhydroperoxidase family enzyme
MTPTKDAGARQNRFLRNPGYDMPRVREIDDAGDDPVLKELFAKERAVYGDLLNPTKVMAHCPPILRAAKLLGASIAESGTLPKGLVALVSLRVAAINGCPF